MPAALTSPASIAAHAASAAKRPDEMARSMPRTWYPRFMHSMAASPATKQPSWTYSGIMS